MRNFKNPYRCETCKQFFPYDERKVKEHKVYNITTTKDVCPFCGSWNITAYSFGNKVENKYLNHDIVKDGRYYAK